MSRQVFSHPRGLFCRHRSFIRESVSRMSVYHSGRFPQVLCFSGYAFGRISLVVVLVNVCLVRGRTSKLFSVFNFHSTYVMFRLQPNLRVHSRLFYGTRFSLGLFLFTSVMDGFRDFIHLVFHVHRSFCIVVFGTMR